MIAVIWKRRRARKALLWEARCVAASFTPELHLQYDPDDLENLRRAAARLCELEGQAGGVLSR